MSQVTDKVVADSLAAAREEVSDMEREHRRAVKEFGAHSYEAADCGRALRLAYLHLRDMGA